MIDDDFGWTRLSHRVPWCVDVSGFSLRAALLAELTVWGSMKHPACSTLHTHQ
jgi:hypothetical protein